jgi:hypothetical protein
MADKKTEKPELEQNVTGSKRTVRSPEFRSIYLNHVQFGFTRFDFQMVLGSVEISRDEDAKQTTQETACVRMSPGYAKAFVQDMANTLAKYEQSYGEISIPRALDNPLSKDNPKEKTG